MGNHLDPGGGTRSENCWGCAAGHWKLDPKRSREKWYFGAKKIEFCEHLYPKDRFCVGGWEKTPQKDRARSCQSEKRGSKPRHICITHHIGSTPPGHLDGLVQEKRDSSTLAVELHLSCTNPLICQADWQLRDPAVPSFRDQSRYAPSQWETSQCNDVSRWLGEYLDWSLQLGYFLYHVLEQ